MGQVSICSSHLQVVCIVLCVCVCVCAAAPVQRKLVTLMTWYSEHDAEAHLGLFSQGIATPRKSETED